MGTYRCQVRSMGLTVARSAVVPTRTRHKLAWSSHAPGHLPGRYVSLSHPRIAGTPLDMDGIVPLSDPLEVWYFDLGTPPTKSDTKTLDLEFSRQVRSILLLCEAL